MAIGIALSLTTGAAPVAAHPDVVSQLTQLEQRRDGDVCDLRLELQIAHLRGEQGDLPGALASLDRAAACDPSTPAPDLARAEILLDQNRWADALSWAHRAVDRSRPAQSIDVGVCSAVPPFDASDAKARLLRGRIYYRLGRFEEAAGDFEHSLPMLRDPQPEDYLDWARTEIAARRPWEASRGLRLGLDRLGPVPALLRLAVELHVEHEDYAAALQDLERTRGLPGQEGWWLRRAEVLEASGQPREALELYHAALDAYVARPPQKREAEAIRQQEAKARTAIARLGGTRTAKQEKP